MCACVCVGACVCVCVCKHTSPPIYSSVLTLVFNLTMKAAGRRLCTAQCLSASTVSAPLLHRNEKKKKNDFPKTQTTTAHYCSQKQSRLFTPTVTSPLFSPNCLRAGNQDSASYISVGGAKLCQRRCHDATSLRGRVGFMSGGHRIPNRLSETVDAYH